MLRRDGSLRYFRRLAHLLAVVSGIGFIGCKTVENIGYVRRDTSSASNEAMSDGVDSTLPGTAYDPSTGSGFGEVETGSTPGVQETDIGTGQETDTIPTDTGVGPSDNDHASESDTSSVDFGTENSSDTIDVSSEPACDQPTMYVEGRALYDTCNERFIPIGVNEMVVWAGDRTGAWIFPQISLTGANAVRFSWSTGNPEYSGVAVSSSELDAAIENCNAHKMVAIVDIHDRGDSASDIPKIVDWWIQPEVVSIIQKHEKHLILNIVSGAGPETVEPSLYVSLFRDGIHLMREAGIRVPLIVETSGTGGDVETLREIFQPLVEGDPLHNLLFGVHMWWPAADGSTARIIDALQGCADLEMPLIISELAPMGQGCVQSIDYETAMAEAWKHGYGFFTWSWGAVSNVDCEFLGMTTDGTYGRWRETPNNGLWGQQVVELSEHSIKNLAVISRSFSVD